MDTGRAFSTKNLKEPELNILSAGQVYIRVRVIAGGGECANNLERTFILNAQSGTCNGIIATGDTDNSSRLQTETNRPVHLSVYPNPATTGTVLLEIQGADFETINTITLLDINGKVVETRFSKGNIESFDTEPLSNGLYVLKVTNSQSSQSTRFVVQK